MGNWRNQRRVANWRLPISLSYRRQRIFVENHAKVGTFNQYLCIALYRKWTLASYTQAGLLLNSLIDLATNSLNTITFSHQQHLIWTVLTHCDSLKNAPPLHECHPIYLSNVSSKTRKFKKNDAELPQEIWRYSTVTSVSLNGLFYQTIP